MVLHPTKRPFYSCLSDHNNVLQNKKEIPKKYLRTKGTGIGRLQYISCDVVHARFSVKKDSRQGW